MSCRARIAASHNAFHTYTCGRPAKHHVGEDGFCGIHMRKLDRVGFIHVWDKDGLRRVDLNRPSPKAGDGDDA